MVLMFQATNNKVEYMVVVIGLCLIRGMNLNSLRFKCDSQLLINQVRGKYTTKDDKMK